ncbi:MAG: hypothetical protein HKP61_09660 [Dactylosporangium sp.]|nr:hypothetical protein [Dactylosporangium sp.]NNJ61198.1 hypothetical protein [Dactylosporangium sp.]
MAVVACPSTSGQGAHRPLRFFVGLTSLALALAAWFWQCTLTNAPTPSAPLGVTATALTTAPAPQTEALHQATAHDDAAGEHGAVIADAPPAWVAPLAPPVLTGSPAASVPPAGIAQSTTGPRAPPHHSA